MRLPLALLLPALLAVPRQDKPSTVTVDLETLKTRHVAVQVTVNGKGPYRLIFDTGAPVTLVSTRVAREAGLPARGGLMGMGGEVETESFQIGGAKVEGLKVMVFDHPTVALLAKIAGDLDGIVGFSFFAQFETTIDYQAGKVGLTPIDYRPAPLMERLQGMMGGGGGGGGGGGRRGAGRAVLSRPVLLGMALEGETATVKAVAPGSAAETAGVTPGDRIVELDGRWIESGRDVLDVLRLLAPGETVPLKVRRGDSESTLHLKTRSGV
jgi:hypothetical protein